MKQSNQIMSRIFWATILFFTVQANAQPGSSLANPDKPLIVKSNHNAKTYNLYVSLPESYKTNDSTRYPVLYVLDGKYSYGSFHSIRQILDMGKEIKDVIIVAISDDSKNYNEWLANRHTDYTPSAIPKSDSMFAMFFKMPPGTLKSGGADRFLKTLKSDIMPLIETSYRTNGDRGIAGHSLGGLFAGYCLLVEPQLFNRYSIASPSFWWDPREITNLLNGFSNKQIDKKITIFISVGKLEGDMMISPVDNFRNAITGLNNNNLMVNSQNFENETHLSVVPLGNSRTLRAFYGHSK